MNQRTKSRVQRQLGITTRQSARMREPLRLLFVYGTLMRGGDIHHLLRSQNIRYMGNAKMRGELYWFEAGKYPGAIQSSKIGRYVHGELYRLADAPRALAILDEEEGCLEGLFLRRPVEVVHDKKKLTAWAYLYAQDVNGAKHLPDGRFSPVSRIE